MEMKNQGEISIFTVSEYMRQQDHIICSRRYKHETANSQISSMSDIVS